MTTLQESAALIARLNGSAVQAEADGKRRGQRAAKTRELMDARFPESARAELRETMKFSVKSRDGKEEIHSTDAKEGSRKAIETEDARRYQALDAKQAKSLHAAIERIAAVKVEMLAAKGEDGKPLFTEADLMDELFSPLVREGLLIENLVIDKHSEVAELLAATYKSYQTMLVDARKAKNEAAGKMEADLSNAGSRLDRVKALGAKGKGIADAKMGNLAGRVNLTADEGMLLAELTASGLMVAKSTLSLATPVTGFANAVTHVEAAQKTGADMAKAGGKAIATGVVGTGTAIGGLVMPAIDTAVAVATDPNRLPDLERAAIAAATLIDQQVANSLVRRFPAATGALDGRITAALDTAKLAQLAKLDRPQATLFVDVVTRAFDQAFAAIPVKDPQARSVFNSIAAVLRTGYGQRVDAKALVDAMKASTAASDDAFDALAAAAKPAADAAFADAGFVAALPTLATAFAGAAAANNEHLEVELETARTEAEQFERRLVLVDEGGDEMARQRSIAQLVAQLERDRKILELVAKVAAPFTSLGAASGTAMKAVAQTGSAVAGTGNAVVAAFSAAQLVIQMSVEIIKIAQRAELARKFAGDIDKARKAGSRMLPAVETFYNSKVAQEIFASVTVALQAVQLAGTIAAGVPEPITAATGTLVAGLASVGQAANTYAQKLYTIVQLERGWNATAEALNNPKNRRAGLDALHANSTLAVHAVAWAANDGDPLATQILRSCGVNAQTLADSATDQKAIVLYLETRLYEDIQFKDGDAIGAGLAWVPSPLQFSVAGWCAVIVRAKKIATPMLDPKANPSEILAAFVAVERQPTLDAIVEGLAMQKKETLTDWVAQGDKLVAAFEKFQARAEDGSPHPECERIKAFFLAMAKSRAETMKGLETRRMAMPDLAVPVGRQRSNAVSA